MFLQKENYLKNRSKTQELSDRKELIEHYRRLELVSIDPEKSARFRKLRIEETQEFYKAFPELDYDVSENDDYDDNDDLSQCNTQTDLTFKEVVTKFLDECVDKTINPNDKISSTELYTQCVMYCIKNNYIISSSYEFGRQIKSNGILVKHTSKCNFYHKIKLKI